MEATRDGKIVDGRIALSTALWDTSLEMPGRQDATEVDARDANPRQVDQASSGHAAQHWCASFQLGATSQELAGSWLDYTAACMWFETMERCHSFLGPSID